MMGAVVGDPERCSGLVYGVPLGHEAAEWRGFELIWCGGEECPLFFGCCGEMRGGFCISVVLGVGWGVTEWT